MYSNAVYWDFLKTAKINPQQEKPVLPNRNRIPQNTKKAPIRKNFVPQGITQVYFPKRV